MRSDVGVSWVGAVCFLDAPVWALVGAWLGPVAAVPAALSLLAVVLIVGVRMKAGGE